MLTQLDPPLPMLTPKGEGLAHFVIDYGLESHLMWVVFLDHDGSCWTVPNPDIRMRYNWSAGRRRGRDAAVGQPDHAVAPSPQRPAVPTPFRPAVAGGADT